ncbi:MAG: COX15/CtaA family protein [Pseudomonadota bacterium]|nr:COX15/CtaA family protein [Pseudomonadota bacterium]
MDSAVTPHSVKIVNRLPNPLALSRWLLGVAMLVFAIVVVGGITRLTESGLSITEWNLVGGVLPPLNQAHWTAEFALYRATPEFREINGPAGMDLAAFQQIYFWEWLHRLLGRLVGVAMLVPLVWFTIRRSVPRGYGSRLTALLLLVGFQGALGWYMVQSGLANRTDVSHFRLATHLLTALFLLAGLIWTALDLRKLARTGEDRRARLIPIAIGAGVLLTSQLLLGAWVAGLDAGQVSNTWPLMNERLVPDGIDASRGAWFAVTHDPYLIHFLHRWWAWVVVIGIAIFARRVRPRDRLASIAIHAALGTQILLGIATVTSGVALPLAAVHQAVGALLVAATAWGAHAVGTPPTRGAGRSFR